LPGFPSPADDSGVNQNIRYGLLLPTSGVQLVDPGNARALIGLAAEVERLGFDSVWAGDSLSRGRIEPLALLSAIAAVTERVQLGTAALMPAFRHPVPAAQALSSLDLLSGGRLVLGVGAGYPGFSEHELDLVGVDPRTRFRWLDDVVDLWRQLWSPDPPSTFHGRVLHHDWLPAIPSPARPGGPPIWLAGASTPALLRTGRHYDGWLPYPPDVADYATGLDQIRAAATEAGRDPEAITPSLFATVVVDEDERRARREMTEYVESNYKLPMTTVGDIQVLITGTAEQVLAGLGSYVDAGARHIAIRIGTLRQDVWTEQLNRLARLPLPR
jgi:alkanesulfonate monooxygenase SsuD/methylene tetrahydromethanopterin reductase-like flavin-dependent oxidoreductase (luciferase family)